MSVHHKMIMITLIYRLFIETPKIISDILQCMNGLVLRGIYSKRIYTYSGFFILYLQCIYEATQKKFDAIQSMYF